MHGGLDNDAVHGQDSVDTTDLGPSADAQVAFGGPNDDAITGGNMHDVIHGEGGVDTIVGLEGSDNFFGRGPRQHGSTAVPTRTGA